MVLVDILYHADLELARQEHDREHRKENQRCPGAVAACRLAERKQPVQLGHARGTLEDVRESVIHAESHEDSDREERKQLDQRFEGYRRHHAFVALGCIQMARPEDDGECGEQQCHVERGVMAHADRRHFFRDDVRILQQNREATRYRLELQRDVGNHADDSNDGDDTAEQAAFAVA